MAKRALVLLAEGFEEIEAVTPIDMLRRAGLEVFVCGLDSECVSGAHGVSIAADKKFDSFIDDIDAIILPGGMPGAENLARSKKLKELIQTMHKAGKLVAAICASPAVVLAPSGILNGRRATAYPGMEKQFGKETIFLEDRVVLDGNIITSRGPGTAFQFSLAILEWLAGEKARKEIEDSMLA